jgi:cytochrome c oxidase cbb3-type subunit IV
MDINDVRVATTLLSLVLFLGIMVWAWSRRRHSGFEEAAQLPFLDAEAPTDSAGEQR